MPKSKQANDSVEVVAKQENWTTDIMSIEHKEESVRTTSPLYVQKRQGPGGTTLDYVDEGYMRDRLNMLYPIWSWEVRKYEFLGKEAVSCHGRLTILDNGQPRFFDALAAHRIAVGRENGNYVDLGNDMKSANTEAFKVACNRLCNISDDVYRKSVLSLSEIEELEKLLPKLDGQTRRKVKESVGNHSITSANFNETLKKLNNIIKSKEAK